MQYWLPRSEWRKFLEEHGFKTMRALVIPASLPANYPHIEKNGLPFAIGYLEATGTLSIHDWNREDEIVGEYIDKLERALKEREALERSREAADAVDA